MSDGGLGLATRVLSREYVFRMKKKRELHSTTRIYLHGKDWDMLCKARDREHKQHRSDGNRMASREGHGEVGRNWQIKAAEGGYTQCDQWNTAYAGRNLHSATYQGDPCAYRRWRNKRNQCPSSVVSDGSLLDQLCHHDPRRMEKAGGRLSFWTGLSLPQPQPQSHPQSHLMMRLLFRGRMCRDSVFIPLQFSLVVKQLLIERVHSLLTASI